MVEMRRGREEEREGGRVCATSAKLIYHVAKSRSTPSFLPSSFSLKREARWRYNSNRSSKSHDCRRREEWRGPIASPSSSSSFPTAAVESYNRRRNSARGRGLATEQRGRERERDGRERYLPETKANRSISRSAFLFEGASISVILKSHFIELENSPLEV